MSGSEPWSHADFMLWPFDPAAWIRIQDAVGQPAEGDTDKVWHFIDQGLVFTSVEQQQQSLPSRNELRARKQRLLDATDVVINLLGISTPSSPTGYFADGEVLTWLILGALRQLHPTGPPLRENSRRERIPLHEPVDGYSDEVRIAAQTQAMELIRELSPPLGLLRELLALSVAETATAPSRGLGRNLSARAFIHYTAAAYEVAYGRPAGPGAAEDPGPTVRFIAAVADEARKAEMIASSLPRPKLGMITTYAIRRLLLTQRTP